jgi:hypothetical protein
MRPHRWKIAPIVIGAVALPLSYYVRQRDTRSTPLYVNAAGLELHLYLR